MVGTTFGRDETFIVEFNCRNGSIDEYDNLDGYKKG